MSDDKSTPQPVVEHLAVMHVDYGITRQPEAYASIKASVSMPIFIHPGDDVLEILNNTIEAVRQQLQDEIDDEFESYGYQAPYSPEPRYVCRRTIGSKIIAIFPQHAAGLPPVWSELPYEHNGHRLSYIHARIDEKSGECDVIDCADGNFKKLPKLQKCHVWRHIDSKIAVITLQSSDIPQSVRHSYEPKWNWGKVQFLDTPEQVMKDAIAHTGEFNLFDCRDGDFTKLPPPPPPADPAAADEDDTTTRREKDPEIPF